MSEGIPTTVKWGKETISLTLIPSHGVKGLKFELEEKTGVPADRMKLMPKSKGLWKGVLKDDFDLSSINYAKCKPPLQILLMGSASKLTGPKVKTVFLEDLPSDDAAKFSAEPSGLVNLGNTCYLNSVIQCLRAVPQLRTGLSTYRMVQQGGGASNGARAQSHGMILSSLRELYGSLDRTADAVTPANFVMCTKLAFPEFARTGPGGQPMQQDAEEFFSGLLTIASGEITSKEAIAAGIQSGREGVTTPLGDRELMGANNLVDAVFGLKMEETLTCDETATMPEATSEEAGVDTMDVDGALVANDAVSSATVEPLVKSYDLHRKLVCNIQGGSDGTSQVNVNHIQEGISLSLNGKIEKRSEVLGRDAVWTRKQRIARLPPVIVVQFGRFYWKQTPDSQDHSGVKCKVMKPVAFSGILDIYDFCSEEVQKVLRVARERASKEDEERIAKKLKGEEEKESAESMDTSSDDAKKPIGTDDDDDEEAIALKAALAMSVQVDLGGNDQVEEELAPVGPGLPKDFQGQYEIFAVVTHKGRDADGGHYMGWVKDDRPRVKGAAEKEKIGDTDEEDDDWFVFDDDGVSPCKTEDVLKLKGGGDWHMSYLNFYRAKK